MASAVDVHRNAHEAFNRRDWDGLRGLVADDAVYTDHARGMTLHGADEFIDWLHTWTGGMSDACVGDPVYLDAGTASVCRFQGRGTNDGQFGPANATGRAMDLPMCEYLEVRDGRMVSGGIYYDGMTMFEQFGLAQPPVNA